MQRDLRFAKRRPIVAKGPGNTFTVKADPIDSAASGDTRACLRRYYGRVMAFHERRGGRVMDADDVQAVGDKFDCCTSKESDDSADRNKQLRRHDVEGRRQDVRSEQRWI